MKDTRQWDWDPGLRKIPFPVRPERFNRIEEPCAGPDGESVAAIVNTGEGEFTVLVNGEPWQERFEKAWALRYLPDGRLVCIVLKDGEWTVCVDDRLWEIRADYIWNLTTTGDGAHIAAAVQMGGEYGLVVNDRPWETLYPNLTGSVLSPGGTAAAVVQTAPMGQGDIDGFSRGIFSAAVDGDVWDHSFMNVWDLSFGPDGKEVAGTIRTSRTGYSVARNGLAWDTEFQCAWKPEFIDQGKSVIAPVKQGGKWFLFRDGRMFWKKPFDQILALAAPDPATVSKTIIGAVVSQRYGKWTVAKNETVWDFACDTMIPELFFSKYGDALIAVFKNRGTWDIAVNGKPWGLSAQMLWRPRVSPDAKILAARLKKDRHYFLAVNEKIYPKRFDLIFEPVIGPDQDRVVFTAKKDGAFVRQVLTLDRIK